MYNKILLAAVCFFLPPLAVIADDGPLSGTVIGTSLSVDYSKNRATDSLNTCAMAFDGHPDTFFASWERSYTWAGLDFGRRHVITRVGWMPRDDSNGPKRVLLGVFEGANRADFMDALPLYVIPEAGKRGEMSYADIDCSVGFRYVRYVGPSDSRCNIAELAFFGHEGAGDSTRLYRPTNLPVVSVHTVDGMLPTDKETEIESTVAIINDDGAQLLSEPATIRERGNASRSFPKKPYRIKFDKKQHVLDAPAKAKKWTLINNYGDKTLMRNLLAFELSRLLGMPYTPWGRAVDVLVNGEYKGCYQLCDQIQVHKKRVNITEMTPQDNSGTALTGGYLIEIDAYANREESWFNSNNNIPVTIKSPSDDSITTAQAAYIKKYFNTMEQQWTRYVDTSTFLRHFLVGELSGNTDTYWSVYMYKQRDNDTIYTGPVWDFDLAFENDGRTYPVNSLTDFIYQGKGSCAGNMRKFVDKIVIRNSKAKEEMYDIWEEARCGELSEEHLVAFVDSLEEALQQSQQLNFLRWPIMNKIVHQNPRIWGSYEAEVENARRFLKERLAWMDNKLGYDPTITGIRQLDQLSNHIDYSRPYRVYTVGGLFVSADTSTLSPGIYIVRQGQASKKLTVTRTTR